MIEIEAGGDRLVKRSLQEFLHVVKWRTNKDIRKRTASIQVGN